MNREIISQLARKDQEEEKKAPLFDAIPGLRSLSGLGLLLVDGTRRSQGTPSLGPRLERQRDRGQSLALAKELDPSTAQMTADWTHL